MNSYEKKILFLTFLLVQTLTADPDFRPFQIPQWKQQHELMQGNDLVAPSAMAFDSKNRPYLVNHKRASVRGLLQTTRNGEWVNKSLTSVLTNTELTNSEGQMVIDDDDHLYLKYANKVLYSRDLGDNFTTYSVPSDSTLELRVGHGDFSEPPALSLYQAIRADRPGPRASHMAWWASIGPFSVYLPRKSGNNLIIGDPILVEANCGAVGSSFHSGGTSFAVTKDGKTHVVYAQSPSDLRTGGNPIYVATIDRATRQVVAKRFIVNASPTKSDDHTRPMITIDSKGYLHILSGSHGQAFYYSRSLQSNSITGGWSTPVELPDGDGQCYSSIVCDADDTLHTVFRMWEPHATLGYSSAKAPDWSWSSPSTLVEGANPKGIIGYGIFYHRLFIDRASNLYTRFTFYEPDNASIEGFPEALVVSKNGGASWKLADKASLSASSAPGIIDICLHSLASIGDIKKSTSQLMFDTDTLAVAGGLSGAGEIILNKDGSEYAVFNFNSINLTTRPSLLALAHLS